MRNDLKELWKFRDLLWQLVKRDLKVRYKNSRLGFLWSIAPPLMQVAVITFAFKHAVGFAAKIPNYSAYLLVAIIPWTYFSTAILDSSQSILLMYGVIKKVYLPREIIPLSTAISNFIHFLLSWLVFFVFLFLYVRATPLWTMLWLPYLVLCQFMLVTGICLLVSALNVFYEDVKYMVSVLLGLGLFAFPIMYFAETVAYKLKSPLAQMLYLYNPLTSLLNGYRAVLLQPPHPTAIEGAPLGVEVSALLFTGFLSFAILMLGYWYFNKRKWQFVERP